MTRVRWLFAGVVMLLPLQLAVAAMSSEPYPAIFQPAFRGVPQADGETTAVRPRVTVVLASGQARDLPFTELLPDADSLATAVFRSGYGTAERANSSETVALLRDRLSSEFGNTVTRVVIVWETVAYRLADRTSHVQSLDHTVTIDLATGA